ncbi:MAG: hypothetical protein ACRDD4_11665 [Culicoidibacterales bacterium]
MTTILNSHCDTVPSDCVEKKGWIDLELEFKEIVNNLDRFIEIYDEVTLRIDPNIKVEFHNIVKLMNFSTSISKKTNEIRINKINNDSCYIDKIQKNYGKLYLKNLKEDLRKDFLEVVEELKNYLTKEMGTKYVKNGGIEYPKYSKNDEYNVDEMLLYFEKFDKISVVNFNYNDQVELLLPAEAEILIWNVHGTLESEIILGHNEINDDNFMLFKKNLQIDMNGNEIPEDFCNLQSSSRVTTCIIGHSLDENDRKSIETAFEKATKKLGIGTVDQIKTLDIERIDFFYHDLVTKNEKYNTIQTKWKIFSKNQQPSIHPLDINNYFRKNK